MSNARCIECGKRVSSLYTNYGGPEKIRLTECPQCQSVADKYVEYDHVLLFLDMVLHKPAVYRHLLFNRIDPLRQRRDRAMLQAIGKLVLLLIMFDVYVKWMRRRMGLSLPTYAYLFVTSAVELFVFIYASYISASFYHKLSTTDNLNTADTLSTTDTTQLVQRADLLQLMALGLLISSFGKFVHILMVIWEYDRLEYAWLVSVNILTSNAEAVSVVLDCNYRVSWIILAFATLCKYSVQKVISVYDPLYSISL